MHTPDRQADLDLIQSNILGRAGTFIGALHEDCTWDAQRLRDLMGAINSVSANATQDGIALRAGVHKVLSYTLASVIHHISQADLFEIRSFELSSQAELIEDFRDTVQRFMQRARK